MTEHPSLPRRALFWVAAAAFVVRLIYFTEHAGGSFFGVPILDESYYEGLARALAWGGDAAAINPGFRPLLYALGLAVWYRLGGDAGMTLALAAQHLLGVATAVLVAMIAFRLCQRPMAALAAGGLYALAGPPLFFEGELLIASLYTFLVAVFSWLLVQLDEDAPTAAWATVGAWIGLAAMARANALALAGAVPLASWLIARGGRQRWLTTGMAGAALGLALVAGGLGQRHFLGHFQLLPSAGGVNLYLGNKAGADGMVPRQDTDVTYGAEHRDSVAVFATETFRRERPGEVATPTAVSRYWRWRAVREIRREPGRWLGLMARKAAFLVWSYEIPNNKSYAFVRENESQVLRVLPVRWWLLLALAAGGIPWIWRNGDRRALLLVGAVVALHAATVVLFFVNSRYRLPLWPGLAALAGVGIVAWAEALANRDRRRLSRMAAIAAAVAVLSVVNWTRVSPETPGRDHFFRSLARLEKGDVDGALADAEHSVAAAPDDAAGRFQLGNARLAAGDAVGAVASFRAAARLKPGEPRIDNNLGVALERLERPGEAYSAYLRAIRAVPDYPPPWLNAALLELRAGLDERAAVHLERFAALAEPTVASRCAAAFLARRRGDLTTAERLLAEARRLDAELVRRLVEENRRPLPAETLVD